MGLCLLLWAMTWRRWAPCHRQKNGPLGPGRKKNLISYVIRSSYNFRVYQNFWHQTVGKPKFRDQLFRKTGRMLTTISIWAYMLLFFRRLSLVLLSSPKLVHPGEPWNSQQWSLQRDTPFVLGACASLSLGGSQGPSLEAHGRPGKATTKNYEKLKQWKSTRSTQKPKKNQRKTMTKIGETSEKLRKRIRKTEENQRN